MSRETNQEIDDAAANWAAKLDRGLSAEERERLEAWTEGDIRRPGAVARAMAILVHFDVAPAVAKGTIRTEPAAELPRRRFIAGGAIAAGLGVVGVMFASRFGQGAEYAAAKGERRSVQLEDGSVVLLNTASTVRVHYSKARREIILLRGEALFDVAKDASRPFVVRSEMLDVRAVGTSFSVSRLQGRPLEVFVREGYVDVGADAPHAPPPTHLMPGCHGVASDSGDVKVIHIGVPAVQRALSWREGLLDLDGMTLTQAAEVFGRYSDHRIVIDDPAAGQLQAGGTFAAGDPAAFARQAAKSLGLHVREQDGAIHLSRS